MDRAVPSQSARLLLVAVAWSIASFSMDADTVRRVPIFRTGIHSVAVGPANIVLHNVYGTSTPEIVTCSLGSAFALTRTSNDYVPVWQTAPIDCSAVAAGDLDRDGAEEVVVGTKPPAGAGKIMVFTPHLFGPARESVQIPGTSGINDVAVGNVDGDDAPEIVVVTSSDAYVLDSATLAIEWTVTGRGGQFVGIGDLEGDGVAEIVIGGSDGHVLNGVARTNKWGYVGGFGATVAMGDVDGDGRVEIVGAGAYSSTINILDGDTLNATSFSMNSGNVAQTIGVGDGDGDGQLEIVIGEDQWGDVRGYRRDGTQLWYASNPEHGVSGVAVGDVDGDGVNEAIWGAGWTSSGKDSLFVGDPASHAVEWSALDLGGPFRIAAADLDADGVTDLAVANRTRNSGYDGGLLRIMDLEGNVRYQLPFWYDVTGMTIGQLDSDPALEIVLLTAAYYNPGVIHVVDGATGTIDWTSPAPSYGSPGFHPEGPLLVANVDGDAVDEILVATTDHKIDILNGASAILQNATPALDATIQDLALADIDEDSVGDLVVATQSGYYVFRISDLVERLHTTLSGTRRVAATNGSFAVIFDSSNVSTLISFDGTTLLEQWRCSPLVSVSALEYVTDASATWLAVADGSTMQFYPTGGSACPDKALFEHPLKGASGIGFVDVNGDGVKELLASFGGGAEIDLFDWSSALRGDVDGDALVTDADLGLLSEVFYGQGAGPNAGGDVNGDFALRPDDLIYLINYRHGTGAPPP